MAKENGGVIGIINTPTSTTASGVWALQDQYEAKRNGNWPLTPFVSPYSARFNSGSSDYLSKTPSSSGNRDTFTVSFWVKRANITSGQRIFTAGTSIGTNNDNLSSMLFESTDTFIFFGEISGVASFNLTTTQLFRDVSAWYHIVVAVDTTQATSSNRIKIYSNGSQITSFSTSTYMTQNTDTFFNANNLHVISGLTSAGFLNGYLSEFYMIDGQALTPSSFGASNASGVWYPIPYTGSYGTNGFYLKFGNASSLGTDSSPNGNNFTVNNLTSVDQSTDSTLNNFCTWNSLNKFADSTITDGNLTYTTSGTSQYEPAQCTIGFSAGKWYSEHKVNSIGATALFLGIYKTSLSGNVQSSMDTGRFAYNLQGGNIVKNASDIQTGLATFTTNDILGIAVDMTNGTIKFYKNGSQVGTTVTDSDITNNEWTFGTQPRLCGYSSNFGSPPYAANSYADGNGYGNFSYAVPSGYYALCTANLNTYG